MVDLDKPLVPFFVRDGKQFNIEYEGIHMVCFNCGKFGHGKDQCPVSREANQNLAKEPQEESLTAKKDAQSEVAAEAEGVGYYGPWMMVERKPRKKPVTNEET